MKTLNWESGNWDKTLPKILPIHATRAFKPKRSFGIFLMRHQEKNGGFAFSMHLKWA